MIVTVHMTITIDCPERRSPGFLAAVPAGKKIPWDLSYERQGAAVAMFNAVLRGEWDCASEYVSRVDVVSTKGYAWRTVRRAVTRHRPLVIRCYDRRGCWTHTRRIQPSAVNSPHRQGPYA